MRTHTLTLISRTLTLTLPKISSPIRHSFLLYHAGSGEEYQRQRTEPQTSQYRSFNRRNYEEESRAVKVTVWWDFENCTIPAGINVERVAGRITAALRSSGIKGPVTITAFGDVVQMSRPTQEALTSTGVCLNHVPHSGKNSSDRSFMADLVYWVTQNPPPAHFFLISTDKDFANILHRLRMSNYNVLLSSNEYATSVLYSAATIMWPWVGLVKGENVIAKHFNHPPDGLYGSWYGHYKGVLDDPFLDIEQCIVKQEESVSETKICPVPKAVINGIRNVLHSYPEGMYISELRSELRRKSVPMDKDFFGYKKFSNLLSSMPTIVKFIPNPSSDGQPLVTDARGVGSVELNSRSTNGIETRKSDKIPTLAKDENLLTKDDKASQIASETIVVDFAPIHDVTTVNTNASLHISRVHDVVADGGLGGRKEMTSEPPMADKGHDPEVKEGFFERLWTALTGARGDHPHEKSDSIFEADSTAREDAVNAVNPNRSKPEKKAAESRSSSTNSASFPTRILVANKSDSEKKSEQCERLVGTDKPRVGFCSQVVSRWQSWMYGAKDHEDTEKVKSYPEADANGNCVRRFTQSNHHPETHELFSQSHFWDALESFLLSSKGSNLLRKSITRDQLLCGLQKEGPCILKDLKESDLLQLADFLILDKKWVEETPSQLFPFKLMLPKEGRCRTSNDHGPNGLSSLFRRTERSPAQGSQDQYPCNVSIEANAPQNLVELKAWFQKTYNGKKNVQPEEFQKFYESTFNKKLMSSSYSYPTLQSLFFACSVGSKFDQGKKKPPGREETLSDCRKLLMDLMKEFPQGFNVSIFRPKFFQRYGYALECQMLGYPKLVSLLQIMPGIKIESSFIMPIEMFSSESLTDSSVDSGRNGASLDTDGPSNGEEWDELGPVSATLHSKKNRKPEVVEQVSFRKVPLLDEEFTDSEDDVPYQHEGSNRPLKREGEDSYFIQLLDSWYSSKEGGSLKEHDEVVDGLIDCSKINSQNPSDLAPGDPLKLKVIPHKRYQFVADSEHADKDKLVESILKKVGDCSLQSR